MTGIEEEIYMKIDIEGSPKEIKELLQAIESSKEHLYSSEMNFEQANWSGDLPKGDINNPIAEPIKCIPSKAKQNKGL